MSILTLFANILSVVVPLFVVGFVLFRIEEYKIYSKKLTLSLKPLDMKSLRSRREILNYVKSGNMKVVRIRVRVVVDEYRRRYGLSYRQYLKLKLDEIKSPLVINQNMRAWRAYPLKIAFSLPDYVYIDIEKLAAIYDICCTDHLIELIIDGAVKGGNIQRNISLCD